MPDAFDPGRVSRPCAIADRQEFGLAELAYDRLRVVATPGQRCKRKAFVCTRRVGEVVLGLASVERFAFLRPDRSLFLMHPVPACAPL